MLNWENSQSMIYENIFEAKFVSRPNRFVAIVEVDGKAEKCHVKNTGRLRELLTEGAVVYVQKSSNPDRKTEYDLICVRKAKELYNVDSQAPNVVLGEWLRSGEMFEDVKLIKPETKYNNSRFDFYVEYGNKKAFIEVKGVTLEKDGVMMFPDAPTERGVKHIYELIDCVENGFEGYVVFVVQTEKAKYFTPNKDTHPEFAEALSTAKQKGVNVLCYNCNVTTDSLAIMERISVEIE